LVVHQNTKQADCFDYTLNCVGIFYRQQSFFLAPFVAGHITRFIATSVCHKNSCGHVCKIILNVHGTPKKTCLHAC